MLTFHGKQSEKDVLIARIIAHEEADAIAQGAYEKWNGGVHRCAVGCSVRDLTERGNEPNNYHAAAEEMFDIPRWLWLLEDRIFEGMATDDAKGWPRRFAEAIPIGVSLDGLADRLAVRRLREECLPLSGEWPESVRAEVVAAIELTIAALEGKGDLSAAESAAESAAWSAANAAESAAWSAANAARSAAWRAAWSAANAARSAANAAESAAWSAAYKRESDRIVEELVKLAVPA